MIRLDKAGRSYGQVVGVYDVTCDIGPGLTALLGPNGAGKSTLLKLITGQMRPTSGQVKVLGASPFANPAVLGRIGYCPEQEALYDDWSGREFLTSMGAMSGLGGRLEERVKVVLEEVGMTERAESRLGSYSKGMRQRIKVAQAILHEPDVLILDEPLNGLDPVGRRDLSRLFARLAEQNRCVLLSSHVLPEVEQMTRQLILIHHGRVLAQGNVQQIRDLIDNHPHRVDIHTSDARGAARALIELPSVVSVRLLGDANDRLQVEARAPDQFYRELPGLVLDRGLEIDEFESSDNSMEAVFNYLVAP